MKLLRYGPAGHEKPGILLAGQRHDVAAFGEDYNEQFFATDGPARLAAFVRAQAGRLPLVADSERVGPPVARPSKIVCVGRNYREHAAELGNKMPDEPLLFLKAPSAIISNNDAITLPHDLRSCVRRSGDSFAVYRSLSIPLARSEKSSRPGRGVSGAQRTSEKWAPTRSGDRIHDGQIRVDQVVMQRKVRFIAASTKDFHHDAVPTVAQHVVRQAGTQEQRRRAATRALAVEGVEAHPVHLKYLRGDRAVL